MVLPASAEDVSFSVSSMSSDMFTSTNTGSGMVLKDYEYTDGTETYKGQLIHWFKAVDPAFYNKDSYKLLVNTQSVSLAPGHDYEMNFFTGLSWRGEYTVTIRILGHGDVFTHDYRCTETSYTNVTRVRFTAPESLSESSRFIIEISVPEKYQYGSAGENARFMISENFELQDRTDNPSWLYKILKKFDDIGNWFDNLGRSISSGLTNLGNKIGGFFTDLKDSIKQKFDDLKQWFNDLGDRISGFFDDLKLKIETALQSAVDEIKSWFIPSDGYFDRKKEELETFAVDHFGAMYQAPDVMVNLIKKFATMSPKEPAITFPAIQFDFDGTRYTLSESVRYTFSWVNDNGQALYYFYHFYRGFVTVILFIGFANYCIKKYNEVFGGGSE